MFTFQAFLDGRRLAAKSVAQNSRQIREVCFQTQSQLSRVTSRSQTNK